MSTIEPVIKQFVVEASQARAFQVFTDGIDRWWPREHHIGKSPLKRAVIEPKMGGRWYAICQDDTECDTGKVLAWEPPGRLVLTWQLTAKWEFDPSFVTEIEVTFTAEGPKRTLVRFEHRNLERYGEAAPELRKRIAAQEGWGTTLDAFKHAAETA
jgi:uncharacterized protein YndB with AHSA1/START domain